MRSVKSAMSRRSAAADKVFLFKGKSAVALDRGTAHARQVKLAMREPDSRRRLRQAAGPLRRLQCAYLPAQRPLGRRRVASHGATSQADPAPGLAVAEIKDLAMGSGTGSQLRNGITAAAGVLLVMMCLITSCGAARAQGAVKAVFGDWQIRCDTPPGAQNEQCALIQSVVAEDRSNAGLTVIILKTADQKSKLMRVVAPLGVLLPSGLGLKIDDTDIGKAGFVRCLPNGCVAEVVMNDQLLNQLKSAKTATFIIFETPETGIGFPLNLKGIAEGYDKLP